MAEKDMIEKTLEGYNDVFADIVNGLLFGGEPLIDEKSLVDAAPASMYKIDGDVHEEERDVAKYWVNQGEKVNVRISLLAMENQTKYDPDMPLRVMGVRRRRIPGGAFREGSLSSRNAGVELQLQALGKGKVAVRLPSYSEGTASLCQQLPDECIRHCVPYG